MKWSHLRRNRLPKSISSKFGDRWRYQAFPHLYQSEIKRLKSTYWLECNWTDEINCAPFAQDDSSRPYAFPARYPPSTGIAAPVTHTDSSLARYTAMFAMSDG